MKTKIKNWLEKHETIYGTCLMFAALATVAFGGAYLGANMAIDNVEINPVINLVGPDGVIKTYDIE